MKKADQIAGAFLLVFSAYILYEAWKMPQMVEGVPDYGFFPFWLGVLMAALSIMLFVNARVRPPEEDSPVSLPDRARLINVAMILAGLGVYAALMEVLGYLLVTPILVILLLGVVEREKWKVTLLAAVLMTAGLYFIFQVVLGVNLPDGVLGF